MVRVTAKCNILSVYFCSLYVLTCRTVQVGPETNQAMFCVNGRNTSKCRRGTCFIHLLALSGHSRKTNIARTGKHGQLCFGCPSEDMKQIWILLLVLSVAGVLEAQRSLVSLSDVITLMSFIDPNWGEMFKIWYHLQYYMNDYPSWYFSELSI